MVISVSSLKIRQKRSNYFMTTNEAQLLWYFAKRWSTKFQVMIGLALFRGMRIGEICAMNLYDFQNENFNKLNVILQKSYIQDQFPILKDFNEILKYYVDNNRHTFKDGYLFPYYSSRSGRQRKHMETPSAEALFSKMRKIMGKEYPDFLDHKTFMTKGGPQNRYRIAWHSCRRWFETRIWDKYKDKMLLRDVMRYQNSKTVDVYIDSYEVWKNEHTILEDTFGKLFKEFQQVGQGQTKLTSF